MEGGMDMDMPSAWWRRRGLIRVVVQLAAPLVLLAALAALVIGSPHSAGPLAAAPGTQWKYHNPNYEIAARLVEDALGWDTDGPVAAPPRLEHTGSLLTYSSYMEILPGSAYGVVVLLNSGSGLMLDQTRIFYGVRDIVEGSNLTPPGPAGAKFNATTLDRVLGLLTLAVLLLGASGVLRARRWARRRRQQWWIFAAARTVPHPAVLAAVSAYPQLAERLVGGRDVTWEAARLRRIMPYKSMVILWLLRR